MRMAVTVAGKMPTTSGRKITGIKWQVLKNHSVSTG